MDERLEKIYYDTIPHSFFLNKGSIDKCMFQAYSLGVEDLFDWLSENNYLNEDSDKLKNEWFQNYKK